MEELLGQDTIKSLGFGGALGFLSGFAFKRVFKVLSFLVGLYVLSLIWLADLGVITVNWKALEVLASSLFSSLENFARTAVRVVSFSGSFAVGFLIGMKV